MQSYQLKLPKVCKNFVFWTIL